MVFQIRGRDIRVKSFTGALQALMNESSPTERWRVERELRDIAFREWVSNVDRITFLRLNLERPNPNYRNRQKIKDLIEGTNARMAEVVVRADENALQGIDVDDPFIQQAIAHVEEHYGSYVATAECRGEQTTWASEQDGAAEIHVVPADPVTKDVSAVELRRELGDPTADDETIAEARAAVAADEESIEVERDIEDSIELDDGE